MHHWSAMIHTHFVLTEFLNVKTDVRRQALKCEPHSALLLLQLHILGNPQSVQPGITTKQAGRPTNQSLQKCSSAGCPSTVHCRRHTLLMKESRATRTCTTRVSLAGNVRQACNLQAALLPVLGLETELCHGNPPLFSIRTDSFYTCEVTSLCYPK